MTRVEAIAILDGFKYNPLLNEQHFEALDMAVSALEKNESAEEWYKLLCEKWDSAENKGEWIPKERTTECSIDIDIVCSKCGYVGIEGYAHGYELNELPVQEMKDYIKKFDMNYCPCCGCSMDKEET